MARHTIGAAPIIVAAAALMHLGFPGTAEAQGIPALDQRIVRGAESPEDVVTTLEIIFLLTVLTLAPSILVMTTAFTRIVIVLSFLRRALATQELPPTQIVIGLALILTFMVMGPTWIEIKDQAIVPYVDGEISQKEAYRRAMVPTRAFMFQHVRREDLRLFVDIEQGALPMETRRLPRGPDDIGTEVLVPAFVISELRKSFEMGFMLYLPFLVIDLVVSTILISMGMLVLPPILISLPFKILLFVLVDGWNLIIGELVRSFH